MCATQQRVTRGHRRQHRSDVVPASCPFAGPQADIAGRKAAGWDSLLPGSSLASPGGGGERPPSATAATPSLSTSHGQQQPLSAAPHHALSGHAHPFASSSAD